MKFAPSGICPIWLILEFWLGTFKNHAIASGKKWQQKWQQKRLTLLGKNGIKELENKIKSLCYKDLATF